MRVLPERDRGHYLSDLLDSFTDSALRYTSAVIESKRNWDAGREITTEELAERDDFWEAMMRAYQEYDEARSDPDWRPQIRESFLPGEPLFPANQVPHGDAYEGA